VCIADDQREKTAAPFRRDYQKLEDVIGCKWSVSVLHSIASGVHRPGELERSIPGISTKVLSERLRKLHAYGLIAREVFAEVPPRTEYQLTSSGARLIAIIAQIHALDDSISTRAVD
jgi:DNA-binding HxlR family transcriptional regulator